MRRWQQPALTAIGLFAPALGLRLLFARNASELDVDEGVYWESLRSLAAGHQLLREVYSSQPPGFLLLLEPAFLLGHSLFAARAMVVLTSLALIAGAWLLARRWAGGLAAIGAGALAATFDPLLLRGSFTLQADVPAVSLGLLSLGLAAEAAEVAESGQRGRRSQLALAAAAGALCALAVFVKILAAPLGLGLLVILYQRRDLRPLAAAAAGAAAALLICLLPFAGDLGPLWQQSVGLHLGGRMVPGGLTNQWRFPPLLELPLLALAALGLLRGPARRLRLAMGLTLAAGALFILVQRPAYPHHLALLAAPAAVAAGVGLEPLLRRRPGLTAAAAAALALALVSFWMPDPLQPSPAELRAVLPPGSALIVTDDHFLAAEANLDTPPWLVDTSLLRIRSGDLKTDRVEREIEEHQVRAVLLGTDRLKELPGFLDWLAQNFSDRRDLGHGRLLYLR